MSWRPAIRFPLITIIGITIILLLGSAPGKATADQSQSSTYYLPIVRVDWTPPCGGVPKLISPPDGSEANFFFHLVVDGGYRGGESDWLGVEVSETPTFENNTLHFYLPAGQRWELPYYEFINDRGQYFWSASVWCLGIGIPPKGGYQQGPSSQTWSFTVKNFAPPP